MKQYLLVVALCTVGTLITPKEDHEANLKAALALLGELTATLKQAKDGKSAELAAPKLKAINGKLAALKKMDEATQRLPPEEYGVLRLKYGKRFEAALRGVDAEVARCSRELGFRSPLEKGIEQFEDASVKLHVMNDAKASAALVRIEKIDKAIQSYKTKHKEFPMSLSVLANGKDALLEEKDLWYPCKRLYCYDASGPRNKGNRPDVWTSAPSEEVIGNWEKEK